MAKLIHNDGCRKRINFSQEETNYLVSLLQEEPVVSDRKIDGKMVAQKRLAWARVVKKFNSWPRRSVDRTEKQLQKLWSNTKTKYKHRLADQKKTGGDVELDMQHEDNELSYATDSDTVVKSPSSNFQEQNNQDDTSVPSTSIANGKTNHFTNTDVTYTIIISTKDDAGGDTSMDSSEIEVITLQNIPKISSIVDLTPLTEEDEEELLIGYDKTVQTVTRNTAKTSYRTCNCVAEKLGAAKMKFIRAMYTFEKKKRDEERELNRLKKEALKHKIAALKAKERYYSDKRSHFRK